MRGRRSKSGKWSLAASLKIAAAGLLAAAIISISAPALAISKNTVFTSAAAPTVTEVTKTPWADDGCDQLLNSTEPISDSGLQDLYECYVDGSFTDAPGGSIFSYIDPFWLSLLALVGIGSFAMIFMGFSAPRGVISGNLIDSRDGAIKGAEVALATLRKGTGYDNTAIPPAPVSESEKRQLEECFVDYVSTTSNAKGQFRFSHVKPGWYWLNVKWELEKGPEHPGLGFNWETKGNFLIVFSPENSATMARPPKKYRALAHKVDRFYYSGDRDLVINFEYMN